MPLYDEGPVGELDDFDDVFGSPELPVLPDT